MLSNTNIKPPKKLIKNEDENIQPEKLYIA
jgi:hypothetical protein